MKIVITGGTGLVGSVIRKDLADWEIIVLTRNPDSFSGHGVAVKWDVTREKPPSDIFEKADVVLHLAGEPIASGRWTKSRMAEIQDSRYLGTANLVKTLSEITERPKVLLSASACGYYGDQKDKILTEESLPGEGFLSEVPQRWEKEAKVAEDLGMRVVYLRMGVILSRESGAIPRMLPLYNLGLAGPLASGKQWFPWIHIQDVIGLIKFAIENDNLHGPINLSAPGTITNKEFTKSFARTLKKPAFMPVPGFGLKLAFGNMSQTLLSSQRMTPAVSLEGGYKFKYTKVEQALLDLFPRK